MATTATYRNALTLGAMLQEYRIDAVLGAGSFGMTYLCTDTNLDKRVAIKEYFPTDLALRAQDGGVLAVNTEAEGDYRWGLERFLQEARTLAKFSHPHIVRVNRYFEANATGYMVMDYEDGESLSQWLQREPHPAEAQLREIVLPLLDGLQAVHESGFLHRDIKPSNIFIRANRSPVLLDFGSARMAVNGSTRSLTAVLTPGYAPLEQYAGDGHQGPWSDIYALGGVLYRALTDENPPDAVSRLRADAVPARLAQLKGRISEPALSALQWALALDEKQRPRTVEIWKRVLLGTAAAPPLARATLSTAAEPATAISGPRDGRATLADDAATRTPTRITPATARPTAAATVRKPIPAPESGFPWRWIGLGALILAVLAGGNAWLNRREANEAARLEATRLEAEKRALAQREADQRLIAEREAQLARLQQSVAEREANARLAQERDEALRKLADERAASSPAPAATPSPAPAQQTDRPATDEKRATPAPQADIRREGFDARLAEVFREMDSNRDGYLTREEARGPARDDFERIDSNGDGRLSMQEFQAGRLNKPPPRFR